MRPPSRPLSDDRGFSLVELGIVISVIAVLASVVLVSRGYLNAAKQKTAGDLVQTLRTAGRDHAKRHFKGLGFGTPGQNTPPALSMQALRGSGLVPENVRTPWKNQGSAREAGVAILPDNGQTAALAAKCADFTCMRICMEMPDQETCDDMVKQFQGSSLYAKCEQNGCGLNGTLFLNVISR
jgi:prepilin-type N-terminal cleavage/methylation domain-containing protein